MNCWLSLMNCLRVAFTVKVLSTESPLQQAAMACNTNIYAWSLRQMRQDCKEPQQPEQVRQP